MRCRSIMKNILALIPARGGSTRVLNKNIRLLGGIPLLAYTVRAAMESIVNRVIVSTNDTEIANVAKSYGAEVPFLRPDHLSTPRATSVSAIHHALEWLKTNEGYVPEIVAFLPPTNPFRPAQSITDCIIKLQTNRVQSAVTIEEVIHHPFLLMKEGPDGLLHDLGLNKENILRTQDRPVFWYPSPACYVNNYSFFSSDLCRETGYCYNHKECLGVKITRLEAFDIDTEEDFEIAQLYIKHYFQEIRHNVKGSSFIS